VISVKRVESGKIVYEDFTNNVDLVADGWQLHPSTDRFYIDLTDGTLNLLHGPTPTYLLRELPTNAVLEMRNTYNPIDVYDWGGFVAYSSDQLKIELSEYYNDQVGTTLTFPYIRMVKKDTEYEGYGSQDGRNWDIRGSIDFPEATLWGVELEGPAGEILKIHTLAIYKDTKIKFRALPLGSTVEVYDISSGNPVLLDTLSNTDYEAEMSVFDYVMPLNLNIKVYDANGDLVADDNIKEVFGGDVFHCGNFIEVYYNGQPLDVMNNDFGYLDDFSKDYRLELRNMIDVPHTNINVEIKQYNQEFGWEWVDICKDLNGAPDGNYSKSLQFDMIPANDSVFFWVRIMRNSVPVMVDDYLFDFVINVW